MGEKHKNNKVKAKIKFQDRLCYTVDKDLNTCKGSVKSRESHIMKIVPVLKNIMTKCCFPLFSSDSTQFTDCCDLRAPGDSYGQ